MTESKTTHSEQDSVIYPGSKETNVSEEEERKAKEKLMGSRRRPIALVQSNPKVSTHIRLMVGSKTKVLQAEKEEKGRLKLLRDAARHRDEHEHVLSEESDDSDEEPVTASKDPVRYFKQKRKNETMDLTNNRVGPVNIVEIAKRFFPSMFVTRLLLTNTGLGNEGARTVAKGLVKNTSVKELDLSRNRLQKSCMPALGELLELNEALENLNLSFNNLTDDDIEPLMSSILVKCNLNELNLSHNILCDEFAKSMSQILAVNRHLQKLHLNSNQLEVSGLVAMAPGLQKTRSLKLLNISWNYLHDNGAKALADVISFNKSLEEIVVCGNFITREGATQIGQSLRKNTSLKILRLGKNLLRNEGAYSILHGLMRCSESALEIVDLDGTIVDPLFTVEWNKELHDRFPDIKPVNFTVAVVEETPETNEKWATTTEKRTT